VIISQLLLLVWQNEKRLWSNQV